MTPTATAAATHPAPHPASHPAPGYRLVAPGPAPAAPTLDADQQRVVDHPGGPLLVLAGPGTGKTTTLVEAIADRIERRGTAPDRVLALTFSRKAAEQLRDRVTARVARTTSAAVPRSSSRTATSCSLAASRRSGVPASSTGRCAATRAWQNE